LIAGLLGLASFIIPIIPSLFQLGYAGLIIWCLILDQAESYLPDWHDWNEMLVPGLKIGGAGLVYTFPLVLVKFFSYIGLIVPALLEAVSAGLGLGIRVSKLYSEFKGSA
jgi:hypothetical protein